MYHIKKDKRSTTSANMLYHVLTECLKTKSFEEISITEITTLATVSRSTFYRNFDELIDILYWKCDQQFSEVLSGYVSEGKHEKLGLLEYVFAYWQKYSEILEILLDMKRIDIIYDCFARNSMPVLNLLRERVDIPKEQENYFMAIRIGIFVGIVQTWITGGKQETARQLSTMIGKQLNQTTTNDLIF